MATQLEIPFAGQGVDGLSALFDEPPGGPVRGGLLFAHGAGHHMESPWTERVAAGLVALGFAVLRFNYPYRQRALREGIRMRPTDPVEVLETAHALALAELIQRSGDPRPLLAGKSLGARISSHLAAKDHPCRGLALFGYPLHPPGKPERQRSEHFPAIVQPALFLQGTRDALCDLDLLATALERLGGAPTVEVLETADHSFEVLKRSGLSGDEVHEWLLDRVDRWEAGAFPR